MKLLSLHPNQPFLLYHQRKWMKCIITPTGSTHTGNACNTLHLWIQWENSSFTYIHLGGWKIWWKWKWTSIAFLFFYSYWPLKVKDIHAALHTMILTTSHPRPIQNHMCAFGLWEKAWDNHAGNLQPESWLGDQNLGLCCCKETVPTTAPQCTINWTGPNENVWWASLTSDCDLELV